jgi:HPt (histidine-containing phosphotransfer) domain-containing protein
VSAYHDPARIAELHAVMGAEAGAMVASMLTSLSGAIERVEITLAAGELDPAIEAAHAARNDALMLGAGQLQSALTEFEAAARAADESGARAAFDRVRAVWPPTRDELSSL